MPECARVFVCLCVYELNTSKYFKQSEPAGSAVVSGVPALGVETDRIKIHHSAAVILP